jgi:hypothetical protein
MVQSAGTPILVANVPTSGACTASVVVPPSSGKVGT